jgi:hypothetical protein
VEDRVIELPVPDGDIPACKPLGAETTSIPTESASLPGGGTLDSYVAADGSTYDFPNFPEGFDPLFATAEELAEY